jgi:hypothetical protein
MLRESYDPLRSQESLNELRSDRSVASIVTAAFRPSQSSVIEESLSVTSPLASTCVVRPNVTSRQCVRVFRIALVAGLAALAIGVAPTIAEAAKKPPPGALGVYRASAEPSSTAAFGFWLGRQPVYALDFFGQESWKQISFPVWWAAVEQEPPSIVTGYEVASVRLVRIRPGR